MARKKILIIDDEKALCKLMKLNLERTEEYEVTIAYSGQEGIERAERIDFDLVITDFRMPDMNGKAVLDVFKKMKPRLPVVLFSIYHDDTSTINPSLKNKTFDGLISKPIDYEQLYKTVKDILARKSEKRIDEIASGLRPSQ